MLAKINTTEAKRKQKQYYDQKARERLFEPGDKVYLRDLRVRPGQSDKIKPRWIGPYLIVEQTGPVNFRLENTDGSQVSFNPIVHSERIKHFV